MSNIDVVTTSENSPLHVDFLPDVKGVVPAGLLGMTHIPGMKEKSVATGNIERDLTLDLTRLKEYFGIQVVVTLNEQHELQAMGIDNMGDAIRALSMVSVLYEIRDMNIPTNNDTFVELVIGVVRKVERGEKVVVHCKAGKGRTGMPPRKAIELVRRTRPGTIQTWAQEKYVTTYQKIITERPPS